MAMTFGDLLEMIRQDYVDHLTAAAGDLEAAGQRVAYEPPFRDMKGEVQLEGALQLPARVDLASDKDGSVEPVQVEAEGVFRFDGSVDVNWDGGMKVRVFPFSWDKMPVVVEGLAAEVKWEPLQQWFWRWFAEPEEGEGGVLEVVHHLSDPAVVKTGMRVVADMGTAPLEAWQDLLDACLAMGATRVVVGEGDQ